MARRHVMVELRVPRAAGADAVLALAEQEVRAAGFELDRSYPPVPVDASPVAAHIAAAGEHAVLIRGTLDEGQEAALEREPRVLAVWSDARVEPFAEGPERYTF